MTFDAQELGARTSRKVWLYVWRRGEKVWRFTSADRNLTINFQAYTAAAISHGEIEQSSADLVRMNVDVVVPMLHPVALQYRAQAPADSVVLTIYEHQADDPAVEVVAVWQGRIIGANWNLVEASCTLVHSPTYTSLQRTGLRRKAQKLCPLVLYGADCAVNREAYRLATTVSAISGFNLTAAGVADRPNGYWTGGYIEYLLEVGVVERRGIKSHTSGTVQLTSAPTGLAEGVGVSFFPGCDHTTGSNGCSKFNNVPNYGGFPYFAEKNPFGANPVY